MTMTAWPGSCSPAAAGAVSVHAAAGGRAYVVTVLGRALRGPGRYRDPASPAPTAAWASVSPALSAPLPTSPLPR